MRYLFEPAVRVKETRTKMADKILFDCSRLFFIKPERVRIFVKKTILKKIGVFAFRSLPITKQGNQFNAAMMLNPLQISMQQIIQQLYRSTSCFALNY